MLPAMFGQVAFVRGDDMEEEARLRFLVRAPVAQVRQRASAEMDVVDGAGERLARQRLPLAAA